MRRVKIATGEHYHVYNRGVDKRTIFSDGRDIDRFMKSVREFNTRTPIGSIHENRYGQAKNQPELQEPLVEFVAYCVLPNHYHFILKQVIDEGIEKFMHRLSVGYSMYFNKKHTRSGSLFQGTYKAQHIDSNEYLLHLSAYINLNNHVHKKWGGNLNFVRSSWKEYLNPMNSDITKKDIILSQYPNSESYQSFAFEALNNIRDRRELSQIVSIDNDLET